MRRGVYPGTFNPPTTGHLAIVDAALVQFDLDELDLAVSRAPLAKDTPTRPLLEHRIEVIEASIAARGGVRVRVTDRRLIADIADGYDVVVMGADKWAQVNDVRFYDDHAARNAALDRLPELAIAARNHISVPPGALLRVAADIDAVSSTAARAGGTEHMTPAARAFDELTGAWTDPDRYDRWLAGPGS